MKDIELLVRGVLLNEDHILLVRLKGAGHTYLPGGHVNWGETLADALVRELREELGVICKVEAYLGAVEHAWEDASGKHHEINHCFLVEAEGLEHPADPESMEPQLEFSWVHLGDLDSKNLMPPPLRKLIPDLLRGEHRTWWATTL